MKAKPITPEIQHSTESTLQTNIVRVNKAIDYIEQNLGSDLSLDILAKVTSYSPFHFHRVFKAISGETPHEFVVRKRIEKIAWTMLKQKDIPIKELAYKFGFDSAVSFSKSFKKYYGASASALRKQSSSAFNHLQKQNSKIGKATISVEEYFSNASVVKEWMLINAKVTAAFLEAQKLVHIRSKGSFDLADQAFEKLREWAEAKGLGGNLKWGLVIHDNPAITGESNISHSACMKLENEVALGDEMGTLTLSEGNYLIGSFEIHDHEFQKAWGGLSIWLMDNGYKYREGPYFELFHSDSIFQEGAKHKVDIHIPIE